MAGFGIIGVNSAIQGVDMNESEFKKITGIILCGGKSSRMGENKAFLEYSGMSLIEHVITALRGLFGEIILVTNTPVEYAGLDAEIVTDIIPGKSSLGGIYTGLFYADGDYGFVCACDMPFIDREFIAYMIRRSGSYDIVVPRSRDGRQPLHALYSRRCLNRMERQITENRLKIAQLYENMNTLEIGTDEIARHSREEVERMFFNVNTKEDWEAVRGDGEKTIQ